MIMQELRKRIKTEGLDNADYIGEDNQNAAIILIEIERAVGIHRCRYCEGHPVMHLIAEGVYECPECAYEETI